MRSDGNYEQLCWRGTVDDAERIALDEDAASSLGRRSAAQRVTRCTLKRGFDGGLEPHPGSRPRSRVVLDLV